MPKRAIPTILAALVVVCKGDRYLLVRERKRGQGWFLPGGRAEPGESLAEAALRETLEETGVPVELNGILRIEHLPRGSHARLRFVFLARPISDAPPKHFPDRESLSAGWFMSGELEDLNLHGEEPVIYIRHLEAGAAVYPLELLKFHGAPYPLLKA
ncbi:MAG: NUDIX domain-containing protein [Planctomycetes bacterium]|nr:NUDIX domain-containing protein [Planctomycetota bacterium]